MHALSRSLAILPLLGALFLGTGARAADAPPDLGGVREEHSMVPMRDGVKLSAYLYFPPGAGPWPVIFEQRYADIRSTSTRRWCADMAKRGYVVALANFRGSHQSEGTWVGYRALGWGAQQDGFDLCEWLGTQAWSTGKVGSFGSSQGGYAQNFLAVTQPPHLVCQFMVDTGLSLYHEGYAIGGAFRPQRHAKLGENARNPDDHRALMEEWFRHPLYDAYWRQEDCARQFDRMNVPCLTLGSWYDFMNTGSVKSWIGRQTRGGPNSKGHQWLVIGPWLHGRSNKGHQVGELVYPEDAAFHVEDAMQAWFDHWLKGVDTGVTNEAPVRYYVMGAVNEPGAPGNEWRETVTWPVKTFNKSYYLHEGGKLEALSPTAAKSATSYVSDPLNPARIEGTSFPGARDARAFEEQTNVRTFTTEPLARPEEWTGLVNAEIFLSSTAKDTDVLVRVSDVYPDGRSILIIDSIRRARFRDGFDREVFLRPDKVYKVAFEVGWISQVFNAGHRIRVTAASTGAPFYEPNPQTGGPPGFELPADAVVATNTIHHSRIDSSRIIAPVPDISTGIGIARPRVRPQAPGVATFPGVPGGPPLPPGVVPAGQGQTIRIVPASPQPGGSQPGSRPPSREGDRRGPPGRP
jgi:uncharacterized protein